MNLEKLQEYICELSSHASQCGGQVTLIGEARNGLPSILYTSCDKCQYQLQLETSRKVSGPNGYKRWE